MGLIPSTRSARVQLSFRRFPKRFRPVGSRPCTASYLRVRLPDLEERARALQARSVIPLPQTYIQRIQVEINYWLRLLKYQFVWRVEQNDIRSDWKRRREIYMN